MWHAGLFSIPSSTDLPVWRAGLFSFLYKKNKKEKRFGCEIEDIVEAGLCNCARYFDRACYRVCIVGQSLSFACRNDRHRPPYGEPRTYPFPVFRDRSLDRQDQAQVYSRYHLVTLFLYDTTVTFFFFCSTRNTTVSLVEDGLSAALFFVCLNVTETSNRAARPPHADISALEAFGLQQRLGLE